MRSGQRSGLGLDGGPKEGGRVYGGGWGRLFFPGKQREQKREGAIIHCSINFLKEMRQPVMYTKVKKSAVPYRIQYPANPCSPPSCSPLPNKDPPLPPLIPLNTLKPLHTFIHPCTPYSQHNIHSSTHTHTHTHTNTYTYTHSHQSPMYNTH